MKRVKHEQKIGKIPNNNEKSIIEKWKLNSKRQPNQYKATLIQYQYNAKAMQH